MFNFSRELIEKLPKTDLHCHFDGSIRIKTLIEFAKKHRIQLISDDEEELKKQMKYGRIRRSLEEYLNGFEPLLSVLQDADDIEQAFFEVCEDAARENVWHLELRYCPYLHTRKNLTLSEVMESCLRAGEKAEREFNMSVRHILCGLRNDPANYVFEIAKLANAYKDRGVVGFDLAGPETGFPLSTHKEAIYFARKNHLFITMHAGESVGPESIYEALHDVGAHRIGHGTSLIKDDALLNYVVNHRIGVEACPKSNLHTGAVESLHKHPVKKFLERGVRVSLNTDNRLCSDTTITDEILVAMEHLALSIDDIKKLLINGFKSAFLPMATKTKMLGDFNLEWKRIFNDAKRN